MSGNSSTQRSALTIAGMLEAGCWLLCAATVAGFLARLYWVFELTTHFRPHLALALAVLAGVWMLYRRIHLATACGVCALLNLPMIAPQLLQRNEPVAAGGARIRLAVLNVHAANERSDLVSAFLKSAEAEVVLLLEVNARWARALEPLRQVYPHWVVETREDDFGMALLSRLPLSEATVIELGGAAVPSIAATIRVGDRDVFLLGTHPLPPGNPEYARLRNEQFHELAAWVRRQTGPVVVMGDLNTTPWSPYFADLLKEGGLKCSAPAGGLCGSWPAGLPLGRILLDHCLVSPPVQVLEQRFGPRIGSDHLPLVIVLQIPASPAR